MADDGRRDERLRKEWADKFKGRFDMGSEAIRGGVPYVNLEREAQAMLARE